MNTRDTLYIKDGRLVIGTFYASELARRYGTPLYVMDGNYITDVCDAFVAAMTEYGNGAVAYANKAFATVATAKLIASRGLWLDAVSGGELFMLKSAGIDMSRVLFHGNNKTAAEIDAGLEYGVGYFVIDSEPEIELLQSKAAERGIRQNVLARLNPGVTAHTFEAVQTSAPQSKFGFDVSGDALDKIKYVSTKSNLNFKGIHVHIGSQIYDHTAYEQTVDILLDFISRLKEAGVDCPVLDIGGGFGIYYTDEDPKFTAKRYGYTLSNICRLVEKGALDRGLDKPFLIAEPGRCIVGEAGVTLYTVGAVKDYPGIKKYVAVDGGMFENPRHALYGSQYSATICDKASQPQTETVTIVGKCCESGDIITENARLQHAETGDIVAVFSTGAYNYSMASHYNLNAVPPVVLVMDGRADYIVKPETPQDLIKRNAVPEWLTGEDK